VDLPDLPDLPGGADPFEQVCEHLRLLGYKTTPDENGVSVVLEGQPSFRVYKTLHGIGFLYPFNVTKRAATTDPAGFFGLLNEINKECVVARFYYDLERDKLFVTAWYPSSYDAQNFGTFFDRLRQELAWPTFKFAEGVQKYLTP
jgi:hypothetical protein